MRFNGSAVFNAIVLHLAMKNELCATQILPKSVRMIDIIVVLRNKF